MKTIGVIFGGKTVEHEVSVITGMQIIENIDKKKYKVIPIYINKEGKWLTGSSLLNFENYKNDKLEDAKEIMLSPNHGDYKIYRKPQETGLLGKKILGDIDVFFPAIHGMNGEDGTIQGIFELMNIPYVGGGVLSSSVGMDKVIMKDIFKANELPILEYYWFFRSKWSEDREAIIEDIEKKIAYPSFVKPSNLGSSIGISKAKDRDGLIEAIEIARNYDRKIIIERAVENGREINCAVMGYENKLETSMCEEPLGWQDILSFEDKYVSKGSKAGKTSGDRRRIPAEIDDYKRREIEDLAKLAFKAIDCRGVSRIDFLLDKDEKVYINEINTIPGSFSFYLWDKKGYPFYKLIDELIDIAIKTHDEKQKNLYTYEANLFNRVAYGSTSLKV